MCCKKRRQNNRNNFIESTNYLERGSPEEINLRERINNNGPKELSNYLIDKLVCDTYNKNFELLGNQCPICLENFEENKTKIIMGGCLHIFHEKCLGDFAEKIDSYNDSNLSKEEYSYYLEVTTRCTQKMLEVAY